MFTYLIRKTSIHINNFKTLLLVIVLLSAISGSSFASDWVKVSDDENSEVFIDKQSLRKTGLKVKVWVKWVFTLAPKDLKTPHPTRRTNQ